MVSISKEKEKVKISINGEVILEITSSELQELDENIRTELLKYGISILLQRQAAGVKNPAEIKDKILSRWDCLRAGKWTCSNKAKTNSKARAQFETIKSLPGELRLSVIESLIDTNSLYLTETQIRELLTEKEFQQIKSKLK